MDARRRALRRAFIAARLEGKKFDEVPAWVQQHLGLETSKSRVQAAVGAVRQKSPHKASPGPPPAQRAAAPAPLIRESFVVDEPALGIGRVLFRITNDGRPQGSLLRALEKVEGVRQIIELDSTLDILVVALVTSQQESDDLRARLRDLAGDRGVERETISFESFAPMQATWRRLAERAPTG
jgi:hypothetical protein